MDSDEDVLDRKIEVLWRVNFEEFLRRVLHKVRYDRFVQLSVVVLNLISNVVFEMHKA